MTKKEFKTSYNTWEEFLPLCDWLEVEDYSSACIYIFNQEELKEDIVGSIRELFRQDYSMEQILELLRKIEVGYDYYYSDYDTHLQYRGLTEADLPEFKAQCLADLEETDYPWDEE